MFFERKDPKNYNWISWHYDPALMAVFIKDIYWKNGLEIDHP